MLSFNPLPFFKMIGPLLLRQLQSHYQGFLDNDLFEAEFSSPDCQLEGHESMRKLLQDVLSFKPDPESMLRFPAFPNLDTTLSEFLKTTYTHGTGQILPIRAPVYSMFCWDAVQLVIHDAFIFPRSRGGEQAKQAILAESNFTSIRELRAFLEEEDAVAWLANTFMGQMEKSWGHRTLRSFFVIEPGPGGFLRWWPGAWTGIGTPLKPNLLFTPVGKTTMRVNRYEETGSGIKAYEWCAELRANPTAEEPDAIACGMVYVFKRADDGLPLSGHKQLVATADEVADTDVLQVVSFLDQHDDAEELINESDLCFVWLWERKLGTLKGAGGECLTAAIKDIKSRFRKVRTVVVDVRPAQFKSWTDQIDPPTVELAKQEAIEAIHGRLHELDLGKLVSGEMRCIVNNHGSDPDEALAALARG
nr:hypothetical protein [uncultured Noviherbaspirillum sp.]